MMEAKKTFGNKDSSFLSSPILTYDKLSKAPFVVLFRLKNADKSAKPLSASKCAKLLDKANVKFHLIKKYTWNTWEVFFENRTLANTSLSNNFVSEAGFTNFIPRYKLFRKGVIRNVDLEITIEEIKDQIHDSGDAIHVNNLFRLKKRNFESKTWEDSESVCIEFFGEELPSEIILWKVKCEVDPYITNVRICFKCGNIGHISKYCEKKEVCLNCAEPHPKDLNCAKQSKCVNCNGEHKSIDKSCPVFLKHKAIARCMAFENIPFLYAKRMVENGSVHHQSKLPIKKQRNFSSFPIEGRFYPDINGKSVHRKTLKPSPEKINEILKGPPPNDLDQLENLLYEIFPSVADTETLVRRIWKTVELHCSISNQNNRPVKT